MIDRIGLEGWSGHGRQERLVHDLESGSALPEDALGLLSEWHSYGQDESEVLDAGDTSRFSADQFEGLWPYCFFHAHDPEKFETDRWKSCRTPQKAISHVVTHALRRHGLIRGVHRCDQGRLTRYLTVCRYADLQYTRGRACGKCSRVAEWTREDLKDPHAGPSVCLRCYSVLRSRVTLWLHIHSHTTCPDQEQLLSKKEKARILYTAFCSADVPPRWIPPPIKSLDSWGFEHPNYLSNDSNDVRSARVPSLYHEPSSSMVTTVPDFANYNEVESGTSAWGDQTWKEIQSDQVPSFQDEWQGEANENNLGLALDANHMDVSHDSTALPFLSSLPPAVPFDYPQDSWWAGDFV